MTEPGLIAPVRVTTKGPTEVTSADTAAARGPGPPPARGRARLRDVAALAGVGTGTVSRALNDTGYVAPETRARVRAAAHALDYRPDPVARGLRSARSDLVALMLPDLRNEFYADSSEIIQGALRDAGYQLVVATSRDAAGEEAALASLIDRRVDGIVHVPLSPHVRVPDGVPVVQLNRASRPPAVPAVTCAETDGFDELTTRLLDAGHRDVAVVVGGAEHSTTRRRIAGVQRALARAGIPLLPGGEAASRDGRSRVLTGGFTRAWGEAAVGELADDLPTAIVAASPRIASGVVQALARQGVAVPGDVSLVSYDDPEWFSLWQPGMTALVPPLAEMGRLAVDTLLALVEARRAGTAARSAVGGALVTELPGRIVDRGSVGPPR